MNNNNESPTTKTNIQVLVKVVGSYDTVEPHVIDGTPYECVSALHKLLFDERWAHKRRNANIELWPTPEALKEEDWSDVSRLFHLTFNVPGSDYFRMLSVRVLLGDWVRFCKKWSALNQGFVREDDWFYDEAFQS
jgi:hypothetical protein